MTKFATMELRDGKLEEAFSTSVDLGSIPSQDPIAFAYGLHKGRTMRIKGVGNPEIVKYMSFKDIHGSNYSQLAQEYLRGYLFGFRGILVPEGTKIKKGEESSYALYDKNIYKKEKTE